MKIAIGTASNYKVNAIKRAFYNLNFEFESVFGKADSEVSEAPCKPGETKQGSINRAKNILKAFPDSDLGIGVEFGYEPIEDRYHMVCWASIVTKDGEIFSEQSSTLELPKSLVEALKNDIDIDASLDTVREKIGSTHTGRKYMDYINKRDVIYECTNNVMLRYLFDGVVY